MAVRPDPGITGVMRRQFVEQMLPAKGSGTFAPVTGTVWSTWSFLPQVTSWLS
ncbi:hypothetical protein ACIHJG_39930 [Streptomyces sp. NPDC052415]|uniref:hypothetical protein n=1 Tax=Streptomyces sp. NPDC052415 TaxID=3365690 RepID=UPI0037D4BDCD